MIDAQIMDLHMHSSVSDGTDAPEALLARVRCAGIELFALTDHDAMKGCRQIRRVLAPGDPQFLNGVEFSCRDEEGKYHILGYGYDLDSPAVQRVMEEGHRLRMQKVAARLDFIREKFGFTFPEEAIESLLSLDNPGKPHIGNMMVQYGYAQTKEQAINEYLNQAKFPTGYVRPETAIAAILQGGGIPVLAHPPFGSGSDLILGDAMERRLRRLMDFGLRGMECFYSGFTPKLMAEMLSLAEKYSLYVTAGSDYHGKNKLVALGRTHLHLADNRAMPKGLRRFLEDVNPR